MGGMPSFRRAMHSFEEVARGCGDTLASVGTLEHGGGCGVLNVKVQELSNVGALIVGMGFWGLLIKL